MNRFLLTISILIGLAIIFAAFVASTENTPVEENSFEVPTSAPRLGEIGSEHSHVSFLVFINDDLIDFGQTKYIDKSPYVHIHDDNKTIIHKHAKGVTLPYFFETLDMELSEKCITLDNSDSYCSGNGGTLSIYVNKQLMNEHIDNYELKKDDKILINYGTDTQLDISIKQNTVPEIPEDL